MKLNYIQYHSDTNLMWQLYMMWSIVLITTLWLEVCRVLTSVASEHMKEEWKINAVHILYVLVLEDMFIMWQNAYQ